MTQQDDTPRSPVASRITLSALGALAGLSAWTVSETWDGSRLALGLSVFVLGSFAVFFALSGPVRLRQAAVAAVALVLPVTLMLLWASLRFDNAGDFVAETPALAGYAVILVIGMPFVAAALKGPGGWRRYDWLFDISWVATVRYAAAWIFTGVFWLLVTLSDQLLRIVGIRLIDRLLDIDPVPFILTGLVLGLALAVVHELRRYVTPFLVLRLLRLLLPPILVVSLVFIAALPVRGLSGLFGNLSVAGTLMAMTLALLTLATAALDRDDGAGVKGRGMLAIVRLSAIVTPILGALAVAAVARRVMQYGWTPDRVAAAYGVAVALLYGLGYGLAALRGGPWRDRLRRTNIAMALATVGVALLWMTPLFGPERISARDQVARVLDGRTPAAEAPVWELMNDWGRAGTAGLARLAAAEDHPESETLARMIEEARAARTRSDFLYAMRDSGADEMIERLTRRLAVRPEGAAIPPGLLREVPARQLAQWASGCERSLPDGRPACVALVDRFLPDGGEVQILILSSLSGDRAQAHYVFRRDDRVDVRMPRDMADPGWLDLRGADIAAILDGATSFEPVTIRALRLGDRLIVPDN
ncbi:hypothetical protein ATO6_21585 [Oceanicola sp. 22II-s10i]|uniref:DUF4153 domain-containing protein n=1 Tax=Oceanicola sp. 22II-s10i TaxID=1317116 RepID=UPI000B521153|nr:DUF4153 domain-containing protein [Oceanicola sp. 22II-s10i]OWU82896.1 hypothetical protein ATO6_21585 [Oceanicola sp. 22II-s10i]